MRPAAVASLLLSLVFLPIVHASDEGFTLAPVAPAARTFHLGQLELTALHDAQILVPNDGKSFGTDARSGEVADVLRAAGAPPGEVTLSVNVLLVKTGGHIVLLDAGTGPEWHGALLASLKLTGVAPGAVTDILITHSHGDHVNGLLAVNAGLAFANARIHMSEDEWEWMKTKGSEHLVTSISDHVVSFRAGETVAPGIRSIPIEGHTPGHVGYEVTSAGARLRDVGDLVHSSIISLARPQWLNGFDRDADGGRAARLSMLAELARTHELVFAPHFPFPGIGYIVSNGTGFTWQPASP
ncbi:MAG TPA: MBL fold metallo-hydrolase [Steroidobacteraceae bacterium]|nr:MBL fold metallo-hydrolase [Steroidobacteraceae bacterium]